MTYICHDNTKYKRLTFAMQSVRVGGGSLGFDLPKILFIFGPKIQ